MNIPSLLVILKAAWRKAMVPWMVGFAFAAGLFAQAQSTNDSNANDYSDFQIIVQRNIFDPTRFPRGTTYRPRMERGAPTFSLAGTMSYRNGMYAFFNGSSSEYQKSLQQGGTIAGYTVTKIDFDGVELQNAGKQVRMTVGAAMRQEGDGWTLSMPGEWSGTTVTDAGSTESAGTGDTNQSAPSTTSLPSGGAASDALQRLMQQRKQLEQK
ncbi:MAG TPA: hypothetical protein VMH87_03650 [Pseudomonadales bacterium]|nr:hypothetical protein [Pseudomonadales bacterium]